MNVVDSPGWLEYLTDGPLAGFFAPAIENTKALVVPMVSVYEVFKQVRLQWDEGAALHAVALMQQGTVVDLSVSLTLSAATFGALHKLSLPDSVIYTTALAHEATLWTQNVRLEGLPRVRYRATAARM